MARKANEPPKVTLGDSKNHVQPDATAHRLAAQPDYLPSEPRILSVSELRTYNSTLQDQGKEAADKWLTKLWQ